MKYFYETHTSLAAFEIEADTDDAAIQKVKEQEGQYMFGVHTIYTKDGSENRVIWME